MESRLVYTATAGEQKCVSALAKFLMSQKADDLLAFMQKIGVRCSLSMNKDTKDPKDEEWVHRFSIYIEDQLKYEGTSRNSFRHAIAEAIARFFILEEHDYHDYRGIHKEAKIDLAMNQLGKKYRVIQRQQGRGVNKNDEVQ